MIRIGDRTNEEYSDVRVHSGRQSYQRISHLILQNLCPTEIFRMEQNEMGLPIILLLLTLRVLIDHLKLF